MDSIAEIGEQIAWLGSALRSSLGSQGVAYSYPVISCHILSRGEIQTWCASDINFISGTWGSDSNPAVSPQQHHEGQCWHGLFQNPVVVTGFPTRNRPVKEIGIEMPIEMMAKLVGCDRITTFAGKFYIKNFNWMLVMAKRIGDVLIWHFLCNDDGGYMSYTDPRVQSISSLNADDIEMSTLESARHVVGWCSQVSSYAGKSLTHKLNWMMTNNNQVDQKRCIRLVGLDLREHIKNVLLKKCRSRQGKSYLAASPLRLVRETNLRT
jgi:hypothetical protein